MFRASLRPSSGGQTALSLPMVFCAVVAVVMSESRVANCVHITGQKGSETQSDVLMMGVKTPETC